MFNPTFTVTNTLNRVPVRLLLFAMAAPKLSSVPAVFLPPKYPKLSHASKSFSFTISTPLIKSLQSKEDLDTYSPLESEILPSALVRHRNRLPRPPTLVYGFALDMNKFVDHVDKICADLGLPPTDPEKLVISRAATGMLLLCYDLKRIPCVELESVYGSDNDVMTFTSNHSGYAKWNKANFKKIEKYMQENDIMDGPLKLKWYMTMQNDWEFA